MLNPTGAEHPLDLMLGGGLEGGSSSLSQAEKLQWVSSTDAPAWGILMLPDSAPSARGWRRPERIPRTGGTSRWVQWAATPTAHGHQHNRATLQRSKNSLKVLYQSKWKFWKWGCQNLNWSAGSPYASFGHKHHQATPPNDTPRRVKCWHSFFKSWVLRFGTGTGLSFCKFNFKARFNCC